MAPHKAAPLRDAALCREMETQAQWRTAIGACAGTCLWPSVKAFPGTQVTCAAVSAIMGANRRIMDRTPRRQFTPQSGSMLPIWRGDEPIAETSASPSSMHKRNDPRTLLYIRAISRYFWLDRAENRLGLSLRSTTCETSLPCTHLVAAQTCCASAQPKLQLHSRLWRRAIRPLHEGISFEISLHFRAIPRCSRLARFEGRLAITSRLFAI